MSTAELAGVAETVGEHESAFGVGVNDLGGLARHRGLNVTPLLRLSRRRVFRGANNPDYLDLGLEHRDGAHDPDHGGAPGHVVLHLFHAVSRLDRNATGV